MEVLVMALEAFSFSGLDEGEAELNRRLYFGLCDAARRIEARDDIELPVVVPEGYNPPLLSDQARAARESKRPDFYWAYHDHDSDEPVRQFVLECKRLTVASRNWVYSDQYVIAGVARFTSLQHGYGMASRSGAMVGYVQRLDVDTARAEVGAVLAQAGLPDLETSAEGHGVAEGLEHLLDREFLHSPYRLRHYWVAP
jgi:hypothetical protein